MWRAIELEGDGIPRRHTWVVEFDDGSDDPPTVCIGPETWLGLTEEDAIHLASVLNGYIDELGQKEPTRKEMN